MTPVVALVEGIWRDHADQARAILRSRIYVNYAFTPACEGMIKVAAKRASTLSCEDFAVQLEMVLALKRGVLVSPLTELEFNSSEYLGKRLSEEDVTHLLMKLRRNGSVNPERFRSDRAVSALLLGPQREILAYGWNLNATVKIRHAEHELVRSWLLREKMKIPNYCTLYTSLKPCAMCAGEIFTACEDFSKIGIRYLEEDTGPMATNSILIKNTQLWRNAGCPALILEKIGVVETAPDYPS